MLDNTGPLTEAWKSLREAVHQLHKVIDDNQSSCQILIEQNSELVPQKRPSKRLLAAVAAALPHYQQSELTCGLLATTNADTLNAIEDVNAAKAQVKTMVNELRQQHPRRGNAISPSNSDPENRRIAEKEWNEKSVRSESLARALSSAGLGSFHLNKVYQPIKVLPPNVERAYWSWQAHQHRIRKITAGAVREQINYRLEQGTLDLDIAEQWRELLKDHEGKPLRRIQWLAPALRLQYSFRETEGAPLNRTKVAGAGICVLQQDELPTRVRYVPLDDDTPSTPDPDIQATRKTAWERTARRSNRRYQPMIEVLDVYTL